MSKPLFPPDDELPEQWLTRWDSTPTVLPTWPVNERVAIVMVYEVADSTEARVILNPDELRAESRPDVAGRRLFFTVPKSQLLHPEICPGLSLESFYRPNT